MENAIFFFQGGVRAAIVSVREDGRVGVVLLGDGEERHCFEDVLEWQVDHWLDWFRVFGMKLVSFNSGNVDVDAGVPDTYCLKYYSHETGEFIPFS